MSEVMQLDRPLPVGSEGKRAGGWWGLLALIVTEGALFGYLLFSYFYLASQTQQHWPPEGLPQLGIASLNTAILLASSVFVWASERCIRRRQLQSSLASMAVAILLGAGFVMIQFREWRHKHYDMTANLYDSLYFTITGFHLLHVAVGLVILLLLLLWTALGYFDDRRYAAVTIGGVYWHFVDVVWLFVFTTLYLTPYLF
ncbi:cytochrome c oxidase subunit 3 [Methylobacter sp. Wu1]|uniref:cytochrome c oxidase subunit 3 n=1 Tax=Methylobacter sp. Wu1 TaxID=3119359 RepID=UPI002F942606